MTDFTIQQSTQKNNTTQKKTNKQVKHAQVVFLCWCVSDSTAIDQPTKARAQTTLEVIVYFEWASAWDSLDVSSVSLPRRSVGLRGLGHPLLSQDLQAFRDLLGRSQKPLFRCLAPQKKTQTLTQLRVRFGVLQVHRALGSWMLSLDVSGLIPAAWSARATSLSFPLQEHFDF